MNASFSDVPSGFPVEPQAWVRQGLELQRLWLQAARESTDRLLVAWVAGIRQVETYLEAWPTMTWPGFAPVNGVGDRHGR